MGFFNSRHKKLARECSLDELEDGYYSSEYALRTASQNGDMKAMKEAMKVHGAYEYAMLYKNTPKYNKKYNNKKK